MAHHDPRLAESEPPAHDGTEQENENRLLWAERMECLAALIAGLTHSLSNLLASTLMSVDLVLRTAPPGMQRQLLTSLQTMTREGLEMVRQLLWIARGVEGEAIVYQPQYLMVEIQKLLAGCLPSLQVITDYPQELWPLAGDPQHFVQLILALCLGGAEGLAPGEALVLSAANIEPAAPGGQGPAAREAAGRRIAIQAEPRAAAGSPGTAELASERQADGIPTSRSRPAGLWLVLGRPARPVAALTAAVGGTHEKTAGGRGERVYLPAAGSPVNSAEQVAAPPQGAGERVLICEEQAMLADALCEVLAGHGYRAAVARSGNAATAEEPEPWSESLGGAANFVLATADFDAEGRWRLAPAASQAAVPVVLMIDAETADRLDRQAPEQRRGIEPQAVLRKPFTTHELLSALAAGRRGGTPS
jgi:CheY-like chemotaxis protein